jgi:Family of unknown function (DUF6510)
MQPRNNDEPLDGNAAGGLLSELFAFDVTTALVICEGCEAEGEIAQTRVYGGAMGAMMRCAHCDSVVIRLVRTPHGFWLDMRGARSVFVKPPAD